MSRTRISDYSLSSTFEQFPINDTAPNRGAKGNAGFPDSRRSLPPSLRTTPYTVSDVSAGASAHSQRVAAHSPAQRHLPNCRHT